MAESLFSGKKDAITFLIECADLLGESSEDFFVNCLI